MSSKKSKEFQERLRAARELRKLSQTDLASRTGLLPSAVSHFETGRRSPSFENLKRLADALDVTTDHLAGRVERPKITSTTAAGPTVEKLFRHVSKLSQEDLELVISFTEMLMKRAKQREAE